MKRLLGAFGLGVVWLAQSASAQVIEVQSNGLTYQTLTKSGITVMFSHLPGNLHQYAIVQVAVSNGSQAPYIIRPEDFTFERSAGEKIRAVPARTVIEMLRQKGNGNDAIKLVTTYENGIYGSPHPQALKGYEARREGRHRIHRQQGDDVVDRQCAGAGADQIGSGRHDRRCGSSSPPKASPWARGGWWSAPIRTPSNSTRNRTEIVAPIASPCGLLQSVAARQPESSRPARLGEEVGYHVDDVVDADIAVGQVGGRCVVRPVNDDRRSHDILARHEAQ